MSSSQYSVPIPGPGRIKRRSTKQSTQRVGTRLEMLEQAITAINQKGSPDLHSRSSSPSVLPPEADTNTPRSTAHRTAPPEGFLVKEGTSTRYVNELFFSRVLEKVSSPLPLRQLWPLDLTSETLD